MNNIYPLTVFYDGNCPLCKEEIALMQTCNTKNRLLFINCAATDFDDSPYRHEHITQAKMLQEIHVLTQQKQWLTGIDALEKIYAALHLTTVAHLLGGRFSKPIADAIYPYFVRVRFVARWLGLQWVFRTLNRFYAKRVLKRTQSCASGQCEL